jgi:CHASE1-domain containing sensor protein
MFPHSWQPIRVLTAAALAFVVPQTVLAQTSQHIVSPLELQKAGQDATNARQQNIDALRGFLGSAEAQQALQKAHMNPTEVQQAVAGLSDQDLSQLAARANNAQKQFAAGTIDDRDLLIILVAIAALILIIVAVR